MNVFLDVIQVAKLMLRNLKFTLTTTLVMTAGLTVALFLFSFVYSTMYAELPFKEGERIRVIDVIDNGVAYSGNSVPLYIYDDLKKQGSSFQQMSAFRSGVVTLVLPNQTRKYLAAFSEPEMFDLTEAIPLTGQVFNHQQLSNHSENVIVISETVALEMFGDRQGIIGKTVKISNVIYKVIGILPQSYKFPRSTDIWLPLKENVSRVNRGQEVNVSIFVFRSR